MTRHVLTLSPDDDLTGVEAGMDRFRIRHLPVVDDEVLVGLVSHRDILRVSATWMSKAQRERDAFIQSQLRVEDVMAVDVRTVHANLPLVHAAEQMWSERRGCLPVVDARDRLVGIVTEADFLKEYIVAQGGTPAARGPAGGDAG